MNQKPEETTNAVALLGSSAQIQEVRYKVDRAAQTPYPLLITGETGTGKSLVARIIHSKSGRPGALVEVNLGGITESLAGAELFGVNSGAFTGASDRIGLAGEAEGGTLILDEVESAPLSLQPSLLGLIEEGSIRRIGSDRPTKLDVRIIATSRVQLIDLVRDGSFRADLYFRLAVLVISLPSLRDRPEDISVLAQYFLQRANTSFGKSVSLDGSAMRALSSYSFPGNIRELETMVAEAVNSANSVRITSRDLRLPGQRPAKPTISNRSKELERVREQYELLRRSVIIANPIWQGRSFPTEDDYCFVLMPFADTDDIQKVYRNHLKRTIEDCGLRCERADDIYDISGVMQSVWESINRSRVIVADVTGRNANVFYELGIAHTLGKPVIIITQSIDHVPFDLRHLRCIVYEFKPGAIELFEDILGRTLRGGLINKERGWA